MSDYILNPTAEVFACGAKPMLELKSNTKMGMCKRIASISRKSWPKGSFIADRKGERRSNRLSSIGGNWKTKGYTAIMSCILARFCNVRKGKLRDIKYANKGHWIGESSLKGIKLKEIELALREELNNELVEAEVDISIVSFDHCL